MKRMWVVLPGLLLLFSACESGEMGRLSDELDAASNSPNATDPFTDLQKGWSQLPPPPEVRSGAASGWTGEELLVWGGYVYTGYSDEAALSSGFAFNSTNRNWSDMPAAPLEARASPAFGWSGEELLVWGGSASPSIDGTFFSDGAAYDPATETWREIPRAPLSERAPLSVWTGEEFIVWGTSVRVDHPPTDGAAYNPRTQSWRMISEAPIEVNQATALWTGEEMIVLGSLLNHNNHSATGKVTGAAYDPASDQWRSLPDAPLSPQAVAATWDGSRIVAWDYLHNASAYDSKTDSWRELGNLPFRSSECTPTGTSIRGDVLAEFCGSTALLPHDSAEWTGISEQGDDGGGFDLVPAASVVLATGESGGKFDRPVMKAYRP